VRRSLPPPSSLRHLLTAALLTTGLATGLAAGCSDRTPTPEPTGAPPAASSSGPAAVAPPPAAAEPDGKRGAELVVKHECARCHDGLAQASTIPLPPPPPEEKPTADTAVDNKHCFHCHAAILDGRYKAPKPATTERWKKNVEHLRDVPTLTAVHRRFRRSWIESFLAKPHDLRPRLAPTMPRLELGPAQIRDIAAFLVPDGAPKPPPSPPSKEAVAEGRELFEKKGCPSCHVVSGTAPFKGAAEPKAGEKGITAAMRLAPDLRHARDRMELATIVLWVKKPGSIKPDALMPETPMSDEEAQKIAGFVTFAELAPEPPKKVPTRLAVLERHVSYEEIKARVFNKICWHCHSDADYAIGDGGPGNTGGFGFVPRGLNLAAYDGILSGSLDDKGERRSIFEPMSDGTPRLLAALLARWGEEAGKEDPTIRGMPLGMPSLSPEDVQLVETWMTQGHSPD
jgi:cytochrome c5